EYDGLDAIETSGLPLSVDADWQEAVRAASRLPAPGAPPDGFADVVALPLLVGDDCLGVALAFDQHPRRVLEADRVYLTRIVDAAAMAILNARLSAQSHRELRRRDALRRVVASISSELDLDSLLARVIAAAVGLLESDRGVISLVTEEGRARVQAVHNLP